MHDFIGDAFEVLGYFIGFWLFIFSRKFREHWLREFADGGWFTRACMVLGAVFSVFIGLMVPLYLLGQLAKLLIGG